ncbi:hypothetical protein EON83_12190 [bacterium]|nr:MAG: hypothetical protein EON83_12190 [bacterium]
MKTRLFLNTLSILGVFAISPILSTPANARVPLVTKPAVAAAPVKPAQFVYIKELRGANGGLEAAQTAIRRFNPIRGKGPAIYLVAAVHIGEKSYYQQVQQFLDKQSIVLYEGVKSSRKMAKPRAVKAVLPSTAASGIKPPVGMQKKISEALDLQFQLEGIRYNRPHFRNSDLDWETISALAAKSGPDTQKQLGDLQHSVTGGPSVSSTDQIMDKLIALANFTPLAANVMRRLLVMALCVPDKSKLGVLATQKPEENGLAASTKKLDLIIINERNKAVLTDLKTLLKKPKRNAPKPVQSIAVFYGAEHMKDIEKHLVSDFGYRTADAQWLTAIKTAH